MTSFNSAFWGTEFLSTSGYDTMVKRIMEGKSLCKDAEAYFKQRSKMEMEYSKSLGNLYKSLKCRDNIGQLEVSWNVFREELDETAKIHAQASQFFTTLEEETHKFIVENNLKRKAVEEKVKKCQTDKATNYNKMTSAKKTYEGRCKDSDLAQQNYLAMKGSVTVIAKDLEKARTNAEKCKGLATKADNAYKEAVKGLERARVLWEQEMITACAVFQEIEEDRIRYMRDVLWAATNVDSQSAVEIDSYGEKVRVKLETCDVRDDIITFIRLYRTGEERPQPIPYQNYYGEENSVDIS